MRHGAPTTKQGRHSKPPDPIQVAGADQLIEKELLKLPQGAESFSRVPTCGNRIGMVWTCLTEPDSLEAQRYLNDKAIAEVVKELTKNEVQTD